MTDMHRNYRIETDSLHGWAAWHVDFDGTEDANDDRSFTAESRASLVELIDEYEDENGPLDVIAGFFGHRYFESMGKAQRIVSLLEKAGFAVVPAALAEGRSL